TNWIAKSDEAIIAETMKELERLFPNEIAADVNFVGETIKELERLFPNEIAADGSKATLLKIEGDAAEFRDGSKATLLKFAVVRTPRSVYAAIPGRNKSDP
ncbi:hypothetical protein T484DRAFT_1775464, partial [Baffinella frigidus]